MFSIILSLYMVITGISFSLFNECYESQKNYIIDFRQVRFLEEEEGKLIIIYGKEELGAEKIINGIRNINPVNRIREERE